MGNWTKQITGIESSEQNTTANETQLQDVSTLRSLPTAYKMNSEVRDGYL